MKTFSQLLEKLTPAQKDQKIYYQYKQITDPKNPGDTLKPVNLKQAQLAPSSEKVPVVGADKKVRPFTPPIDLRPLERLQQNVANRAKTV